MKLLKYCNIKNIFESRTAGKLSIPFLGYHLISQNDFSRIDVIKKCVKELRSFYPATKSILVTKETSVSKLKKIVNEIEFDGVQLHYEDSETQAASLKNIFGKKFIIFQVVTPLSNSLPTQSDYVIFDSSFIGGTGIQIPESEITSILHKLDTRKVLIAGGISPTNLYNYLNLQAIGFDIQSAIKSDYVSNTENTDFNKMVNTASLLGYEYLQKPGQVGFAVQDINRQNGDLLASSINANIDFFHIDYSDGFVGNEGNIFETINLLSNIKKINSHLSTQIHLFIKSQDSFTQVSNSLESSSCNLSNYFLHINRDNFQNFTEQFIKNSNVYFALDVKDIIDEKFPWEQFIKEQIIICLQSKDHDDRIENLNSGIKLIRYSTTLKPIISIDRNVDYETVLGIENKHNLNIVCGSYLKQDISRRYILLKELIYEK